MVLIHGFAADIARNWAEPGVISGLADHYRVIAIDNRGHGRSDKPHDPQAYGINMVSDVARLLDHLSIQKAHIVGYSMGGRIASVFLTEHPERVRTATLGAAPWADVATLPARVAWANQLAESLEQGKGMGPLIIRLTPRGDKPPNAEQLRAINKIALGPNDALALAAAMRGNARLLPSASKLRANRLPVLAIVGERDPLRSESEGLVAALGSVKLVVIPGANHTNAFGRPEFLEALKMFLKAHATEYVALRTAELAVDASPSRNGGGPSLATPLRAEAKSQNVRPAFRSDSTGVAIPYGIYELLANRGSVVIGVSHDTPAFAANAIAHWRQQEGSVKRAIANGDIRKDLDPIDLLRALIGVASVATSPDWQPSARRLVDILIAGARPVR